MLIEIKNRFSGDVIFSHDCENNSLKITVESAVKARANLYGADLYGANLYGANLYGANLYGANLYGADLYGADLGNADLGSADLGSADLGSANLGSANLRSANLGSANLRSANLGSANLYGADLGEFGKLTENRPYFAIGPIGSRQDTLAAFRTDKGVFIRAGCFFASVAEFLVKLEDEHGDNVHATEYKAALAMIDAHYAAWPV